MIRREDTIMVDLPNEAIHDCICNAEYLANYIVDRSDLHTRSYLERFIDILMGEIAERAVIEWLISKGKYAVSAVDKKSKTPDLGHDIWLKRKNGEMIRCSVKSSLSVFKSDMQDIITKFKLASKKSELREVNIQVYFWLDAHSKPRTTVPSNEKAAIIGWATNEDLLKIDEESYATEARPSVNIELAKLRTMESLLQCLA